jgi:uncharacterized protein
VLIAVAGLLVGFGTRLSGGYTSGHGRCGVAAVATLDYGHGSLHDRRLDRRGVATSCDRRHAVKSSIALVCGLMFGAGLTISGMTAPQKVLGFLDILGPWDPRLIVVMATALAVIFAGFTAIRRRAKPFFAAAAAWPSSRAVDAPLVGGATLFGIGWGLVGLCPGPAIVDLSTGSPPILLFAVAMAVGMVGCNLTHPRRATTNASAAGTG